MMRHARFARARKERIEESHFTARIARLVFNDLERELAHVREVIEFELAAWIAFRLFHQASVNRGNEDERRLIPSILIVRFDVARHSFGRGRRSLERVHPLINAADDVISRREFQPSMFVAVVRVRRAQRVDELVGICVPEVHPKFRVLPDQIAARCRVGEKLKDRLIVHAFADGAVVHIRAVLNELHIDLFQRSLNES